MTTTTIYKVTADRVDIEGRFRGEEEVGFASTKEIAKKVIANFREEHQVNQWWCDYRKDENKNIKMNITEVTFFTE